MGLRWRLKTAFMLFLSINTHAINAVNTHVHAGTTQAHAIVEEVQSCGQALALAGRGQFAKAKMKLDPRRCPMTVDLITWLYLKSDTTTASFHEYVAFLQKHQGWPWESMLKTRAELRMDKTLSQAQVLAWFKENPPKTVRGMMRYVQALASVGQKEQARKTACTFWVNTDMNAVNEKNILENLKTYIRPIDVKARVVRLLNEGKVEEVQRMLNYLSPSDKPYVKARIALQKKEDNASVLLQKSSLKPLEELDLAKDYLTWLRKRQDPRLLDYFQRLTSLSRRYPEKFWKERYILAHEALEAGESVRAYKFASHHGLSSGVDYVEAEWFCGWVALRFMNDPQRALSHFTKLDPVVKTPISRSRVGYWLGRTYESIGRQKEARAHYQKAAQYKSAFYGQQALHKLGHLKGAIILEPLEFTQAQRTKFESLRFVRAIRLLAKAALEEEILPFAYVLAKTVSSAPERRQILALTHEVAPRYAVEIAHVIAQQQSALHSEAYPLLKPLHLKHLGKVDAALAHAVIRKESKFNPQRISPAGARGLMQLMPATAKALAAQCGTTCPEQKLITDPLLNVKLGTVYLEEQLEKYDHCLPLTLASYNAGPGIVSRWLTRFPDPRHQSVDFIDWIEILPYSETRNYIHRVLENYVVYKAIMNHRS